MHKIKTEILLSFYHIIYVFKKQLDNGCTFNFWKLSNI